MKEMGADRETYRSGAAFSRYSWKWRGAVRFDTVNVAGFEQLVALGH